MTVITATPASNGTPHMAQIEASWSEALHVYKSSLDLYRRAMAIRIQRHGTEPRTVLSHSSLPATAATSSAPALNGLTARESEVARLIASGYSNQQIADRLVLTRGTVANHVAHILGKLGVSNRTQVAALVYQSTPQSA